MSQPLLFCSLDIVPSICKFRDSTPKVCCCFCPEKWECHAEQARLLKETGNVDDILPCVELTDEDENWCKDCDYLT
jgi:hypothetical protein